MLQIEGQQYPVAIVHAPRLAPDYAAATVDEVKRILREEEDQVCQDPAAGGLH